MLLSDIGTKPTKVCDGYFLSVDAGGYIVILTGVECGKPGHDFQHPNVAISGPKTFEFKHSATSGRKWWTQSAGVEFCFIVRKDKIEVLPEVGNSYPKVKIAGEPCSFSCTGGTGRERGTWCDSLGGHGVLGINPGLKFLKHLATITTKPEDAKALGFKEDTRRLDAEEQKTWLGIALRKTHVEQLKAGDKLFAEAGYTFGGSEGPFAFEAKRGKQIFARDGKQHLVRGTAAMFDWHKVALENDWTLPSAATWNKVGEVLPSRNEEEAAFKAANKGRFLSSAAWGDWHPTVPKGMVGLVARIDGNRDLEEGYFLVPHAEYDKRLSGLPFLIDTDRHERWIEHPNQEMKHAIIIAGSGVTTEPVS